MTRLLLAAANLCACVWYLRCCAQGVCKFLSSMTASSWTKKARASSKAGAAPADDAASAAAEADPAAVLRQWLLGSRGKGLLELIEALGGKPVSLKVKVGHCEMCLQSLSDCIGSVQPIQACK